MSRTTIADPLQALARERPEYGPWLRLLDAMRAELGAPEYDAAVSNPGGTTGGAPKIDGATLAVSLRVVDRWVRGLLSLAAEAGAPASLATAASAPALDALAVTEAAITADRDRLDGLADAAGADRAAFAAVAAVAAMPWLHACARRWSSAVMGWDQGYCPICGAWPAFAEARGLERERRLRCARCAGDWRTEWLRCPHCGNADHLRQGALASEATLETRRIETCGVCRRYVKTVTTLGPTPAAEVAIQDLATVDLDVAALAHGHDAATGLGYPVKTRVIARPRRSPLRWTR